MSQASELWSPKPEAARLVQELLNRFTDRSRWCSRFAERLRLETGTRLLDWVDHLSLPEEASREGLALSERLTRVGFEAVQRPDRVVWRHPGAMFPEIELGAETYRFALKVDSVVDFLVAQREESSEIIGQVGDSRRRAKLASCDGVEAWCVERRGDLGWESPPLRRVDLAAYLGWFERLRRRRRDVDEFETGFLEARRLIQEGIEIAGVDGCCAAFFDAERRYWETRNRAAQRQKARQDRMGLGWANHDHHTYRSGRPAFRWLNETLEMTGVRRRERFYAGREAGWGAQVMEQPVAGITVFADVDLTPDEIRGDFASAGLESRDRYGTVGLWCALHGEAFLEAGMHHLECQFDFEAAREQLAAQGVSSMKPFTDFTFLRQCFTEGERWPVAEKRIARLLAEGAIDSGQADRFRREGAVGSHLEILERNDGFKGFNQTGISEIILQTDPRRLSGSESV